jgi:hypothetical protein
VVVRADSLIELGEEKRLMSKSLLEVLPTWMQSYLRGVVRNHKVDDEVTLWIQNFTKSALDLISKAMVVGVLHYLARKGQSTVLKIIAEMASVLLIIYCVTYVSSWRLRLFHPLTNRRLGALLDIAVGVGISVALLVGVSVAIESSVHEIGRLEGK